MVEATAYKSVLWRGMPVHNTGTQYTKFIRNVLSSFINSSIEVPGVRVPVRFRGPGAVVKNFSGRLGGSGSWLNFLKP